MKLKVLDLSRVLAGPICSMVLGDLGADVIKVERPGSGDETRGWGPPFGPAGHAACYYACNRGAGSVAPDLRDDNDREVVLAFAQDAHVLLENFLPGTM